MVEDGIGSLQSDELRQLCVEVMIILSRLVQLVTERYSELLPKCQYLAIDILQVCLKAQEFYFQSNGFETRDKCPHSTLKSDYCGTNSICKDFTSLAPSGSGGTLSFITKSLIQIIFWIFIGMKYLINNKQWSVFFIWLVSNHEVCLVTFWKI